MATRSQQFRAMTERAAASARTEATAVPTPPHTENGHVERKATVAHEEGVAIDLRSRKSTRKSANHAKSDAPMEHAAQMRESSPSQSFARSEARASRVRGGGAQ